MLIYLLGTSVMCAIIVLVVRIKTSLYILRTQRKQDQPCVTNLFAYVFRQ